MLEDIIHIIKCSCHNENCHDCKYKNLKAAECKANYTAEKIIKYFEEKQNAENS